MEPTQGAIDFTELDERVNSAWDSGLGILITFTSIPPWANGSDPGCDFWGGDCAEPPTSASFFAAFASSVVSRYKDKVSHWEIWNEPDYSAFWTGTPSEWMTTIVTPGASAIRTADSAAKIVGPATYASSGTFQSYAGLSCSQLDYLSAHFYLGSVSLMFNRIDNQFLPWIASNCNKPLWVTETGIDSWVTGEATQASEYVAAYVGSIARFGVEKMFVFQWADGHPVGGRGWGLVETELRLYRPKRSFWEVGDHVLTVLGLPNRTVIRDSFANNTSPRPVGAPLSGTQTERGARTWSAVSTVVLGTSEVTTSVGGSTAHPAGVPFNPPADPNLSENVVEADLILAGTDWIAVGFSLSGTSGFWGDGQVWATLSENGGWAALAHGLTHLIGTGQAPEMIPGGLNKLSVHHDRNTNEVSVNVNGNRVLNDFDLGYSFLHS